MRILIVDDDALIRESLTILLRLESDVEDVQEASNGVEALTVVESWRPDVVLMDIRMPEMDGILCTQQIRKTFPDLPVILLTTFHDDDYIAAAVRSGASGYILKNQRSDSIIESLRTAIKGHTVFQREVMASLSELLTDDNPKETDCNLEIKTSLTPREQEVLALIGDGMSNREIGKRLFLSEGTVRNYVTAMLMKLQLRDRTQLAIFNLRQIQDTRS